MKTWAALYHSTWFYVNFYIPSFDVSPLPPLQVKKTPPVSWLVDFFLHCLLWKLGFNYFKAFSTSFWLSLVMDKPPQVLSKLGSVIYLHLKKTIWKGEEEEKKVHFNKSAVLQLVLLEDRLPHVLTSTPSVCTARRDTSLRKEETLWYFQTSNDLWAASPFGHNLRSAH